MALPRRRTLRLLAGWALGSVTLGSVALLAASAGRASGRTRFLAVADTGSGDANQRAVGQRMAEVHRQRPVDLVLLGGDNIYPSGNLALVETTFRRSYRELLAAGVPFHAVLGNHDIRTANGAPQVAYRPFGMAGRWYSLRRGDVAFFMLDTNMNADWGRQLPWLRRALAESDAPWKVVVGHHPIHSSGFYGSDPVAQRRLGPLFRRYGVQLYINGHEHNYERTRPIEGTTYLIVGGGGASLRPVRPTAISARAVSAFSFAEVEAAGDTLTITAWDRRGNRLDQGVIRRR
jgi:3',5'-cyclic AMP phosphodiesterase CpdA